MENEDSGHHCVTFLLFKTLLHYSVTLYQDILEIIFLSIGHLQVFRHGDRYPDKAELDRYHPAARKHFKNESKLGRLTSVSK